MVATLMGIVADEVAGDPTTGQQWIRRSLAQLQKAMSGRGYSLGCETIRRILLQHRIGLKSNVKRLTPQDHPDRDQQFQYIQSQRQRFQAAGEPIISVDTKSKELIGAFKNPGRIWCQQAPQVNIYDFPHDAVGKAVPYGIYEGQHNLGYVYVGQSADTPDFAVDCIVHWWQYVGRQLFSGASELLILADGGGSNGYRPRRWKYQLQVQLADPWGLAVTVCHYPSGASKWNPVEHRLFSEVSKTWAGTPLTSFESMLECIRTTETKTGLKVQAFRVEQHYETGLKVSDEAMETLALEKHSTCPAWNYTIRPRKNGK